MSNCQYCNQNFVRKYHLNRHVSYCKKRDTSEGPKCPHCDKMFSRQDAVNRHVYTCRLGPVKAGQKRSGDDSVSQEVSLPPKKAKKLQRCELCDIEVQNLHSHLRSTVHRQNQRCEFYDEHTEIITSAYKSRIISYRVFADAKHLTPEDFMENVRHRVVRLIADKQIEVESAVKVNLELFALYTKQVDDCGGNEIGGKEEEIKSFNTKNKVLSEDVVMEEIYNLFLEEICAKADEFQERDSGWAIDTVLHLEVNINKFSPLRGSSYIPLPKWIKKKHACINVKNNDDACFAWAIVSALYPVKLHSDRTSAYPHYKDVLNLEGVSFPMSMSGIRRFEALNNVSVNVFEIKGQIIAGPIFHTKNRCNKHINLLLVEHGEKQHYCWIKSMSKLIRSQTTKHTEKIYVCDGCLLTFSDEVKYTDHIKRDCSHIVTNVPSKENNILNFKNHYKQLKAPVVVYADFEALLVPIASCAPSSISSYTCNYQVHKPYSFGYFIKCSYDESLSKFVSYRGEDCVREFLKSLEEELAPFASDMKTEVPMHPLTDEQICDFQSAINCHICSKELREDRVQDHDHFTGKFRGAAHSNCNLNFKSFNTIPIVMHNLSGYDSHLIMKSLNKYVNINLIPKNKENYISFTIKNSVIGINFRFIDSLKFMASSLDKLVKNLSKSQLNNIISHFPSDKVDLLCRKGVFPYEYIDSWEKLEEESLPPKEDFYNKLSDSIISDTDYEHAQKVWQGLGIKTLGEYSDIYLKTDVLLLADVFENFREVCLKTYQLDPAHYYTAPGLSWDAMLKHTKIELELLTDIAMIKFIGRGIRGGLSQCSCKYSTANNKYISGYDPIKDSKYIVYLDANNLYGWAMSQYLPKGDFRWLAPSEISGFSVEKLQPTDGKGYFLEVDLEYPSHLHDLHNDLPFCPENKIPSIGKTTKTCKLLATLEGKSHYVIHYINLKQSLEHGLKLKKIHRVIEFTQRPWLLPYINLNTNKRMQAKNSFEKDFYKLMNNAVFGKTMENVEKRVDVRIVSSWESQGKRLGARALISRLNFHSSTIIGDDIAIIQMNKNKITYDKPIYIGFSVLELSKTLMYEFHYDYMLPKYKDKLRLLYTDTDSFIYEIGTENFYKDIQPDLEKRFDTSDFSCDNIYNLPLVNKKVVGMFKDECAGTMIEEFIGIRSKCYYIKKVGVEVIKKIKGIQRNVVAKDVSGDDYYRCITDMGSLAQYKKICVIRSQRHEIYSQTINKIALKNYDDKRFPTPDVPHQTLALGHKDIDKYYFV